MYVLMLSFAFAALVYFIYKKTAIKRKTFYSVFTFLTVLAVIMMGASVLIGGWTGLGLGAIATYIGLPSLITLLLFKAME